MDFWNLFNFAKPLNLLSEYSIVAGSQLLDLSAAARKHALEKFPEVLVELCRGMQTLLAGEDLCTVLRQQQLHVLIKVHISSLFLITKYVCCKMYTVLILINHS